jgi:hypothetical protein
MEFSTEIPGRFKNFMPFDSEKVKEIIKGLITDYRISL